MDYCIDYNYYVQSMLHNSSKDEIRVTLGRLTLKKSSPCFVTVVPVTSRYSSFGPLTTKLNKVWFVIPV